MSIDSLASSAGGRNQVFVKTCMYKGSPVAIKKVDKSKIALNRDLMLELKKVNVAKRILIKKRLLQSISTSR